MMNVIVSIPQYNCVAYLRQFVVAQYRAAPTQAQNRALQFFHAMDIDGNGIVDYREFRSFFHSEGFQHQTSTNLFMMLDGNGDHGLDFWEVMTLYYILKTGIRYNICNNCNACRLQSSRQPTRGRSMQRYQTSNAMVQQRVNSVQRFQPMSNAMVMYPSGGSPSQYQLNNQIVPWNRSPRPRDNRILKTAFRALEFTLGVASLVVGVANCSIM